MKKLNLNKVMIITFIVFFFIFFITAASSNHCIAIANCMHQTKDRTLHCAAQQCLFLTNGADFTFDNLMQIGYLSFSSEIPYLSSYRDPLDRPPTGFAL